MPIGRSAATLFVLAGCAFVLAGCVADIQRQVPELHRATGANPRVVIMPLDVELFRLTAGGLEEPHNEWTEQALKHMRAALDHEAKSRNVHVLDFKRDAGTAAEQETAIDLKKLHRAVGGAVLMHQYIPGFGLPNRDGKFTWSLGPAVAAISRTQNADYALFLYVRDSYATAGRAAVIIVGALLGVGVQGGMQVGFASLVDLKTGDIVWFNRLIRGMGDLRTAEVASETVKVLVSDAMR
jgi:hypothetical protein